METKTNERADFPFLFFFSFFVQSKKMAQKGGGLLAHMSKRLGQVNVGALIGESVRNYWAAPVVSTLAYLPYEWYTTRLHPMMDLRIFPFLHENGRT